MIASGKSCRSRRKAATGLVRLVSMFLNYSALESGKLVLQLRENDLRDCIKDLTCRWQDAFQRANVRLDIQIHPELGPFKFDYQKVQQCMANFLDNASEAHARARLRNFDRRTALLGAPHLRSSAFLGPSPRPSQQAQ